MVKPKKFKVTAKDCENVSTWYHYATGYNVAFDKFTNFLPDEKELYGILLNNGVGERYSKELAKIISKRLQWAIIKK